MDIAFTKKDQKQINFKKRSFLKTNKNEDTLWIATILTQVTPLNENYLYLKHTQTGFGILQLVEGNIRNLNNIKRHLKKAFKIFIDWTKERTDIDAGTYESFTEDINLVNVSQKYQKLLFE